MFHHPRLTLVAVLALLAPGLAALVPQGQAETAPAGDAFVVIAVVDTGINPYHMAFRGATYPRNVDADPSNDVDFSAHPSTYIPGFPTDAPALRLSLDAPDWKTAVEQDDPVFDAMVEDKLYWIPGTNIIGGYDSGDASFLNAPPDTTHLLDDAGHGTGASALAAGHFPLIKHVLCKECLLVAIEGTEGLKWALQQDWIDVISNSWGTTGNAGVPLTFLIPSAADTRRATERGQMVMFASGNGAEGAFLAPTMTYTSSHTGPSWIVRVGGFSACAANQNPCQAPEEPPVMASGKTMDLSGPATGWIPTAARHHFTDIAEFSGTSAATPVAAGYAANALLTLREAMNDAQTGQRPGSIVAMGDPITGTPFPSVASDGVVTRAEWWDLVFYNSAPPLNQTFMRTLPAEGPGNYVWYGWGMANSRAVHQADMAALGLAPWLDKSEERRISVADKLVQETLWGQWDRNADGAADSYRTDFLAELGRIQQELA